MFNLIVSNKPSPLNKKLIKFLNMNLLSLNKASISFDFEVAHPNKADSYIKRGITQYPVLMQNDTSIVGVEKIIQHLKSLVVKHNTKIKNKTDGDRVDDFWKQTIGNFEMDENGKIKPENDDDENSSENLQHKIQAVFEKRSESIKPGNPGKTGRLPQQRTQTHNNARPNNKPLISNQSNKSGEETPAQTIANMKKNGNSSIDDDLMAKFFENQEESI